MDLGLEPAVLFVTLLIFTPILLWFCCIYLPTTPGNKSRSALAAIMKIHCDANFLSSERSPLTDVDKWTQPFTHGQVRTQNALRHVVIRTFHNFPSSSTHLFVLLAGPPTHGRKKKNDNLCISRCSGLFPVPCFSTFTSRPDYHSNASADCFINAGKASWTHVTIFPVR